MLGHQEGTPRRPSRQTHRIARRVTPNSLNASDLMKRMSSNGKLLLLLPPVVSAIVDAALTLCGQADGYWAGTQVPIFEVNPIGYYLLSLSPLAFIAGISVWILVVILVLLLAPTPISKWMSLAIFLTHLFAASTWIMRFDHGLYWAVLMFVAARVIVHPIYFSNPSRITPAE